MKTLNLKRLVVISLALTWTLTGFATAAAAPAPDTAPVTQSEHHHLTKEQKIEKLKEHAAKLQDHINKLNASGKASPEKVAKAQDKLNKIDAKLAKLQG